MKINGFSGIAVRITNQACILQFDLVFGDLRRADRTALKSSAVQLPFPRFPTLPSFPHITRQTPYFLSQKLAGSKSGA